jgi:hypothetical protein
MGHTSEITNLRDESDPKYSKLTDGDKEKMGTDGQVMLVKTLSYKDAQGITMTQHNTEFYDTVAAAQTAKAAWDD